MADSIRWTRSPSPAVGAALTIFCVWLTVMSWQVTAPMTGVAYRWHRRRWVSACLRDHRSATGSRSGLRYQAIRSAPGLVMFAAPVASRCLTFSSFAASFSSRDGLALLPLAVLVPDRPPPAPLVPGRVHGDPEVQLDDFPVAPGGGAGLDAGNPAGCLRPRRSRFAGRGWPCRGAVVGILWGS